MLELIFMSFYGEDIYKTAKLEGRSGWRWVLLLIVVWLCAEFIGLVAFNLGWEFFFGSAPSYFFVYIVALSVAALAGSRLGKVLNGLPSLIPPPRPSRAPSQVPKSPSARRVPLGSAQPTNKPSGHFKFACPQCGQHISATTDQVATEANCPTCHQVMIIPSPGVPISTPSGQPHLTAVKPTHNPSGQFKFACSHCGQRISAITDQVATEANCPTCATVLIVPSPGT